MNRPSAAQAKEFDAHVRYWQQVLNLGDWRMERGSKPAAGSAMADVDCDSAARLAIYRLGNFGAAEINTRSLSETALHECLHVFLYDLITTAQEPRSTPEQLEVAEHRVINVLERVLGEMNAQQDCQR